MNKFVKTGILFAVFVAAIICFSGTRLTEDRVVYAKNSSTVNKNYTGLKKQNGYTYYYKNGKKIKSKLKTVNGNIFYFDKKGRAVVSKLKTINGHKFYFNKYGHAIKSKLKTVNGNRYYFNKYGHAVKSKFIKVNGNLYYFNKNGVTLKEGKYHIGKYLLYINRKGIVTRRVDKSKPMVSLTYDDGPTRHTPALLKTLEENNAVATFFCVGNLIPAYRDTVKWAYALGCEIANHTYDHKNLTTLSVNSMLYQYQHTVDEIVNTINISPAILRPPGGNYNDTVKKNIPVPIIYWSIDTRDWATRNVQSTIDCVLNNAKDGDIILMHDSHFQTVEASKTFIPELKRRGFELVTVSELAECKGVTLEAGKVYYNIK